MLEIRFKSLRTEFFLLFRVKLRFGCQLIVLAQNELIELERKECIGGDLNEYDLTFGLFLIVAMFNKCHRTSKLFELVSESHDEKSHFRRFLLNQIYVGITIDVECFCASSFSV